MQTQGEKLYTDGFIARLAALGLPLELVFQPILVRARNNSALESMPLWFMSCVPVCNSVNANLFGLIYALSNFRRNFRKAEVMQKRAKRAQ